MKDARIPVAHITAPASERRQALSFCYREQQRFRDNELAKLFLDIRNNRPISASLKTESTFLRKEMIEERHANGDFGYVPEAEINAALRIIVPQAMERYHINEVLQVVEEYRCFEDFDFRKSNQKTDFIRRWYHTRTRHPQISLEGFRETYAENHDGQEWDLPDSSQDVQEAVESQILVEQFKETLSEKDLAILELRMQGYTMEEIAVKLGYKNHSGVLKRIRKIGQAYETFTGEDLGFEDDEYEE